MKEPKREEISLEEKNAKIHCIALSGILTCDLSYVLKVKLVRDYMLRESSNWDKIK